MDSNDDIPVLLTIAIPAHDEERTLPRCLSAVSRAVEAMVGESAEVLVLDDGSTDATSAVARHWIPPGIGLVLSQENTGRAQARYNLLLNAAGEYVLMLDAHVELRPESLRYWQDMRDPRGVQRTLWSGDLETILDSPYACFWDSVTTLGWARYLMHRRLTSFGLEEFDSFPKGTGMFLAPREVWLRAYAESGLLHQSSGIVSDDTRLLRSMAARDRIWISPGFSAVYRSPRTSLTSFIRNAAYRGTTFVDSYWNSTSVVGRALRSLPFLAGAVSLGLLAVGAGHPRAGLVMLGLLTATPSVGGMFAGIATRKSVAQATMVAAVAPAFTLAFGVGLARGYTHVLRSWCTLDRQPSPREVT